MNNIILLVFAACVIGQITADEEELKPFGLPILRGIPDRFSFKGESRIFGGDEVEPHSVPYQVALNLYTANDRASFCGGSIISNKYILTAAHCLWNQVRAEIIMGGHNLQNPNKNQLVIAVGSESFILHEEFIFTVANDIAVIRLPTPIKFTKAIQPISLPSFSDRAIDLVGVTATVSGWGRTEASSLSQVLLRTEEQVINNDLCVYYYGSKVREEIHVCTGGENRRGPCSGDSGGPLVVNDVQVGIVSFGPPSLVPCFEFSFPKGYTRVTHFLEWINENTDVKIREN